MTNKTMKKILVSGGLGFIGYHLCNRLLTSGDACELTIVDNLSSTQLDYSSLVKKAEIHLQDFRNFNPNGVIFDCIYHLASPVGSLGILKNNGYVAENILSLAQRAADLARQSRAPLVYLSSSEVYGRDGKHGEDSALRVPDLRGTRMEYALGKLTAEHVLLNRSRDDGFELKIVRPFNVVGPQQSDSIGFVMPSFFKAALAGRPIPVFGDGSQRRAFCHVDDLVSGLITIMTQGLGQTVYNVGNPNNLVSIVDLANRIRTICQSNSEITLVDPQKLHGEHYLEAFEKIPDIRRMSEHVNWAPEHSLDVCLDELLDYYQSHYQSDSLGHEQQQAVNPIEDQCGIRTLQNA